MRTSAYPPLSDLTWRPDRGSTNHVKTTTASRLTSKVDTRAHRESRGRGLTWAERFADRQRAAEQRRLDCEEQRLAELDAMHPRHGVCYFIGGPTLIKIGYSKHLNRRLSEVRRELFFEDAELLAVATGGRTREVLYHQQFAAHRSHGEWFSRCPEIEAEIARLSTPTKDHHHGK